MVYDVLCVCALEEMDTMDELFEIKGKFLSALLCELDVALRLMSNVSLSS